MAQKLKNAASNQNSDITCETYIARHFKKEKHLSKLIPMNQCQQKSKEKIASASRPSALFQNQIAKVKSNLKQQNLPSPTDSEHISSRFETHANVPIASPRHRSKSSVTAREPWGQLLKSSKDNLSLFSSFDPLRTLHFLAKELQFQLQTVMPDNVNIQQIISDIHYALKRVPPEVASTIQLQQTIELLPIPRKSCHKCEKMVNLRPKAEKITQTHLNNEENEKLQAVMTENTLKLEASCKHLENLCSQLKYEREHLETQLKIEKDAVLFLKKQIEVLESEKNELLNVKLKASEEKSNYEKKANELLKSVNNLKVEKTLLESQILDLTKKLEVQAMTVSTEMKSHIKELQHSLSVTEKECAKLKHHLRVCAIEKEKYLAILEVRDRQVIEIRSEMNHLQEIINEQLIELHSNAVSSIPNSDGLVDLKSRKHKENIGDTISSITTNDDEHQHYKLENNQNSLKELQSGDTDVSSLLQESFSDKNRYMRIRTAEKEMDTNVEEVEKPLDPRSTIKEFFDTLKLQAYSLTAGGVSNS